MAFKFILLATLVAAASAGLLPVAHHGSIATSHSTIQHHAAPAIQHVGSVHAAPAIYQHSAPAIVKHCSPRSSSRPRSANYEFSYSVHDEHTGDIKSQHETRHGDEVHGQYSLLDSDGHQRIVDYHADHHTGFNAVVRREPSAPTIIKSVEHHAPANYEFSYSVHDEHTGDIKSQHETRHGDEVHGQYSLLDSDGHQRIVDYHADHHTGFNAVVRREPSAVKIAQPVHKVIAQPVHVSSYAHAPVAHATVQHHHAAPIAHYSAPIAHHAAPIAHYAAPIAHHAAPIAHSTSSIVHGPSHLSHHHY
uniref:Uncharacterized protein n=1 Tax=Anopheles coluzzii TaxID=1518534 RepID=A0A8W7NXT5_ANOCL